MNKMTMVILGGLLVAFFVAGCSVFERAIERPLIYKTLVQHETLAFIDADPAAADKVEGAAVRIQLFIQGNPEAPLRKIEAVALEVIPWHRLTSQEAESIWRLIGAINQSLERYAEQGSLSEDERVHIITVLDWIIEAARRVP